MTTDAHSQSPSAAVPASRPRLALRFALSNGSWSVALDRLHHLAAYAALAGEPDGYFLGWLAMSGEEVPVFDLNRVVCDEPTPEHFGSRVMVLKAGRGSPSRYIGLLAAGITDTIAADDAAVEVFDPEAYLPMLYAMIPERSAGPLSA